MQKNIWDIFKVTNWSIHEWMIAIGVVTFIVIIVSSIHDTTIFHNVSATQTLKCEIKDLNRKDFFGEKSYRFNCESSEITFIDEHSSEVRFKNGDNIEISYILTKKVEKDKTSTDLVKPDKIKIVSSDLGELKSAKWGDIPDLNIRNIKVTKL